VGSPWENCYRSSRVGSKALAPQFWFLRARVHIELTRAFGGRMTERKHTGPDAAKKGIVEDVKGKVKEAAGAAMGKDQLRREGSPGREGAS
jgi:hypothetical protein